jgi:hypothetical protein
MIKILIEKQDLIINRRLLFGIIKIIAYICCYKQEKL